MEQSGHEFLASLGKSRLRPGGKAGTEFLLANCPIRTDWRVLEVACNRGYNVIDLAKRFNCQIVGLDQSAHVVALAKDNIEAAHLSNQCSVVVGNACQLPFPDASFDVIINEAMLTMLPFSKKKQALQEYSRVLKKGGYLLTHDLCSNTANSFFQKELSQTIRHLAEPLALNKWQNLLTEAGFVVIKQQTGAMSLLNLPGLLRDEGILRTFKIIINALRRENRQQFKNMFNFFRRNGKILNYVAFVSQRQ